jgi:hypothetical protein
MKNLLLLLAFATALTTQAQKFDVGVNGGLNVYAGFKSNGFSFNNKLANADVFATCNISAAYKYKRWKVGIATDFYQMGYFKSFVAEFDWGGSSLSSPGGLRFFIPARLFVNRSFFWKGNVESYIGLSAGTILNPVRQNDVLSPNRMIRSGHLVTGFCGGAQVGYTNWFGKHLGLGHELNINYVRIGSPYRPAVQLCSFSLTMGLRYRL